MEPQNLQWAAEVLGAKVVGELPGEFTGVCTDTRKDAAGALFFALTGENFDGHEYVRSAFEKGAVAAVVSREIEGADGPLLVVPDTLRALGDLARAYRRQFAIPVVGVTGSVGKTSTKEMIAAVLRTKYNVLASDKNFNNEIGVPMTLFGLARSHEVAVIEMGMRGLGEIDSLAEIAEPTIGLITNIGFAHIERLGSQQNIAQAKTELFARLPNDGIALVPFNPSAAIIRHIPEKPDPAISYKSIPDEELLTYVRGRVTQGCRQITWGLSAYSQEESPELMVAAMDGSVNRIEAIAIAGDEEGTIVLNVPGYHHLRNAAAALAVGYALNVPLTQMATALAEWKGAAGRMAVRRTSDRNLTVLDDCYNAGLESMQAALTTLSHYSGRKVAVLGDMKELGDFSEEAHRLIGQAVSNLEIPVLVTVGELAAIIADEAKEAAQRQGTALPEIHSFADSDEAATCIEKIVQFGDVVLVKGSRAMAMEKIVATLSKEESLHG